MKRFIVFLVFLSCFSLAQAADYSRFIGSRVLFGESTTPPACFYGDSQQKVTAEYWQKNIAGHEAEIRQNRQGYLEARLDSGVSLMFPRGMGEEREIAAFGIQKIIPKEIDDNRTGLTPPKQWYSPVLRQAIQAEKLTLIETYAMGLRVNLHSESSVIFPALRDILNFYNIGLDNVQKKGTEYTIQTNWSMDGIPAKVDWSSRIGTTLKHPKELVLSSVFCQNLFNINGSELIMYKQILLWDFCNTPNPIAPQFSAELSPWLARLIIRLDHPTDWQEILMKPENNP